MIDTRRRWDLVHLDSYIRDGNGEMWRVAAIDEFAREPGMTGTFLCVNAQDERLTISPKPADGEVTVVIFDGDEADEAAKIKLLRDGLDAEIIARKRNSATEWTAEAWPTQHVAGRSLSPFREHLTLMHGMYATDIKTFPKLLEAHEAAHAAERPHVGKMTPHRH